MIETPLRLKNFLSCCPNLLKVKGAFFTPKQRALNWKTLPFHTKLRYFVWFGSMAT